MSMSTRNISVLITGNSTSLQASLAAASREIAAFSAQASAAGGTMSRSMMMWSTAAKAGALLVVAAFAYSVKAAADFDKAMRNVNSISHLSETQLKSVSNEILNMSKRLPQSAKELAGGMYEIASSGFTGAKGLKVLDAAAVGASAGLTDAQTSAKGILAVLNAYGLSVDQAAHVTNVLFTGVDVGILTFEEMSNVIGKFMNTAAALKVPIEDSTAALAAMTLSGINAHESATSLNRLLQSLIKTSAPLTKVFESWGFASGEAAVKTLGLRGVMEKLRKETGGNVTQLLKLFPEIRAVRGALALMANDGDNYLRTSKAMAKADEGQGAAKKALAQQMKSASAQWQLFINWVNAGAIVLGAKFLPILMDAVHAVQNFIKAIGDIASSGRFDGIFDGVQEAIGLIVDAGGNLIDVLSALVSGAAPVAGALAMIAGTVLVATLVSTAKILEMITSLLAHHKDQVVAVVAAYVTFKTILAIWPLIEAGVALATSAFVALSLEIAGTGSIAAASTGILAMFNVQLGLTDALAAGATLGLAAFAGGAVLAFMSLARSADHGREAAEKFIKSLHIDTGSTQGMLNDMMRIQKKITELATAASGGEGATPTGKRIRQVGQRLNPFSPNDIDEAEAELKRFEKEQSDLQLVLKRRIRIARDLKMSFPKTDKWIETLNLDPATQSVAEMEKAIKGAKNAAHDFAQAAKLAGVSELALAGGSDKATQALYKQADAFVGVLTAYQAAAQADRDVTSAEKAAVTARTQHEAAIRAEDAARRGIVDAQRQEAAADRAITEAKENVSRASRAVAAAERGEVDARKAAERASKDVTKALEALATARRAAAGDSDEMRNAEKGVVTAEEALAAAQRKSLQAQDAITDAREKATRGLYDMGKAAKSASLSEKEAQLALAEAIDRRNNLGKNSDGTTDPVSANDRLAADLAVERAQLSLQDAKDSNKDAQEALNKATAAGVEGSPEFIAATEAATQAAKDEKTAKEELAAAQATVKKEQAAAAQGVIDAESDLADAYDKQQKAQQAVIDAHQSVVDAQGAQADAAQGVTDAQWRREAASQAVIDAQQRLTDQTAAVQDAADAIVEADEKVTKSHIDRAAAEFALDKNTKDGQTAIHNYILKLLDLASTMDPNAPLTKYIQGVAASLSSISGDFVTNWILNIQGNISSVMGQVQGLLGFEKGGIKSYATGGVEPAHVQRRQRIRYAEPKTGGEAYVPKRGDRMTALATLMEAASWYGMTIVPPGYGDDKKSLMSSQWATVAASAQSITPMEKGGIIDHGKDPGQTHRGKVQAKDGKWYDPITQWATIKKVGGLKDQSPKGKAEASVYEAMFTHKGDKKYAAALAALFKGKLSISEWDPTGIMGEPPVTPAKPTTPDYTNIGIGNPLGDFPSLGGSGSGGGSGGSGACNCPPAWLGPGGGDSYWPSDERRGAGAMPWNKYHNAGGGGIGGGYGGRSGHQTADIDYDKLTAAIAKAVPTHGDINVDANGITNPQTLGTIISSKIAHNLQAVVVHD